MGKTSCPTEVNNKNSTYIGRANAQFLHPMAGPNSDEYIRMGFRQVWKLLSIRLGFLHARAN